MSVAVRGTVETDRALVCRAVSQEWLSPRVVSRGRVHLVDELPGLVAVDAKEAVGLLTYRIDGAELEVVTLQALERRKGIGRALLAAAVDVARESGCRRLWLVTTNDNAPAHAFYAAAGMRLAAIHRGSMRQARLLKPEIPQHGLNGVPIEDEVEFEVVL